MGMEGKETQRIVPEQHGMDWNFDKLKTCRKTTINDGNGGQGNTENCSKAAWEWMGTLTNSRLVVKQISMMQIKISGRKRSWDGAVNCHCKAMIKVELQERKSHD